MKIISNIAAIPDLPKPIALAIGTFDGVHLGHQYLIQQMKRFGHVVILTFTNHPTSVLHHHKWIPSITEREQKLELLERAGAEVVIIQAFTKELTNMTYNLFLEELYETLPFNHLFFGEEDALGKDREGTPDKIREMGKALHFTAHYLDKFKVSNEICSSSAIRKALGNGDLKTAEKLLGRPFTVYTTTSCPMIDKGLLKEGSYDILIQSSTESESLKGEVTSLGEILFTSTKHFDETIQITFTKG